MLSELIRSDSELREESPGIYSVLPPDVEGASYDSRAASYDRVVGSELYNRLMWGVSTERYRAFVDRALEAGDGPLLDAGAGSAVFTAEAYVQASRPLILLDRSIGMLEAARDRMSTRAEEGVPDHVTFLQADVEAMPFRAESIATILSMGMLHLFEDVNGYLDGLLHVLTRGGTLFATSLVAERVVGRQYLRLLHRAGEVASPRSYHELRNRLSGSLDSEAEIDRDGSMAFLTVHKG